MLGSGLTAMRALLVLLLAVAVTGCVQQDPGTADCTVQIRVDDVVYSSYGLTDEPASEHGTAERAECHDVGADAEGSVFPDDPETVTTWAFDGHSPDQVLGVPHGEDSFAVFIAPSVPDAERDRIMAALD